MLRSIQYPGLHERKREVRRNCIMKSVMGEADIMNSGNEKCVNIATVLSNNKRHFKGIFMEE
jgi:hypothetical protein